LLERAGGWPTSSINRRAVDHDVVEGGATDDGFEFQFACV
jgi:hypothetical protein